MALTVRKKTAIGLVITGVVCVAIGIILGVTAITPVWVPVALLVIDVALTAIGIPLLYKPEV